MIQEALLKETIKPASLHQVIMCSNGIGGGGEGRMERGSPLWDFCWQTEQGQGNPSLLSSIQEVSMEKGSPELLGKRETA